MDHLQQHIEQAIPKADGMDSPSFFVNNHFVKQKPKGEVLILPSPTPSGDQLMHDIKQGNPICKTIRPGNNLTPIALPLLPPPPPPHHIRSPPTPPPLDKLQSRPKVVNFNPEKINEYKVKGNRSEITKMLESGVRIF